MTFIDDFKQDKKFQKKVYQAFLLYGSIIISMGLSFISSMFTTRYLNPTEYGNMEFISRLWYFLSIIITFGFFQSTGQALLKENNPDSVKQIIGADLLMAFLMGIAISAVSFFLAVPIEIFFGIQIASILKLLAPLLLIAPFKDALALIFQCTNKIVMLSIMNIFPPLLFLCFLVILPNIRAPSIINIIYAQEMSFAVIILFMFIVLKPTCQNFPNNFRKIIKHQRTYGTPVFIAVLSSVATQQINRLSIVYWVNSASIGYYSLANQLAEPVGLIPSAFATTAFKDFSIQKFISKKVLWVTILTTVCAVAFILIILGKPLEWFYPLEYVRNIAPLGIIAAFSAAINGFGNLFNRFLGAHGQGNPLRNTAFLVGIFNILGFLVLTPIFGIWGTLGSSLLGNCAFLVLMFVYYKEYLGKIQSA